MNWGGVRGGQGGGIGRVKRGKKRRCGKVPNGNCESIPGKEKRKKDQPEKKKINFREKELGVDSSTVRCTGLRELVR